MSESKQLPNNIAAYRPGGPLPDAPRPLAPFPAQSAKYPTYMPLQPVTIGSALKQEGSQRQAELFKPITIRGVTWPNRMWVAPMCMYSSDDGKATDFHLVHHGAMALRGWGNLMVEATGVVPEGRISPQDMGIWSDDHIAPLKRVVDFVHAQGAKIGIQLAHAGRKASTNAPWVQRLAVERGWKGGEVAPDSVGGWPSNVYGPSAIPYDDNNPDPIAAPVEYIQKIVKAFGEATERAKKIGFDYIEIHGAHGYWNHNFCDPVSNHRKDEYGGSFENRVRMSLEVVAEVRKRWEGPLLYRVSATDWLEYTGPEKLETPKGEEEWAYWGIEQTTLFAHKLRDAGVDLLDVSSGGNEPSGRIDVRPGYQVPYAEHIKKNVPDLLVGAVGLITDAEQAETILATGQADVVLFGREVLRGIDFPLESAVKLGVAAAPACQYERAWGRMLQHVPAVSAVPGVKPLDKGKEKEGQQENEGVPGEH